MREKILERYSRQDSWLWLTIGTLIILGLLITVGIMGLIQKDKQWQRFLAENDCVLREHRKGDVQVGIGIGTESTGQSGSGVIISQAPSKNAWLCNDDVIYWR